MFTGMSYETSPPERLLTTGEAARRLSVNPATLAKWSRAGKVPAVLTLGGHRRFDPAVIDALLEPERVA